MRKPSEIFDTPEATGFDRVSDKIDVEGIVDKIIQSSVNESETGDYRHFYENLLRSEIAATLTTLLNQAEKEKQRAVDEALRNVPVGFVRQWINEDLLKDGHALVTNDDIQSFINIAITISSDKTDDND